LNRARALDALNDHLVPGTKQIHLPDQTNKFSL